MAWRTCELHQLTNFMLSVWRRSTLYFILNVRICIKIWTFFFIKKIWTLNIQLIRLSFLVMFILTVFKLQMFCLIKLLIWQSLKWSQNWSYVNKESRTYSAIQDSMVRRSFQFFTHPFVSLKTLQNRSSDKKKQDIRKILSISLR